MFWNRVILSWMTLLAVVFASAGAAAAADVSPKTHVGAIDLAAAICIKVPGIASAEEHPGNPRLSTADTSDVPQAARGAAGAGRTVLGHYPAYVNKAAELGARRFQIPTSVWNKMSPSQQWAANQKFLDRMIARGDDIILATPAAQARAGSFFARELQYLKSQGFQLADDGLRMFKP